MSHQPSVPALDVFWPDGRLVGRVLSPGPTYFAYADSWLASGHNLSPLSVPFSSTPFRQRTNGFDALPGFLSDCLPDQWGRRLMALDFARLDLRPTPMKMLSWVGQRGLGALSFVPCLSEASGGTWEAVRPLLLTREVQAVYQHKPSDAFALLRRGGTAGGAFPKATVAWLPDDSFLIGGDVATAASLHPACRLGLLKLDSEDDPTARSTDGRMEHAYMRMAQAAGIHTSTTKLIADRSPERTRHHLFVERFDCQPTSGLRAHALTLAGALHAHNLTYSNLFIATRRVTADHKHVLEAVRRMLFNVRSGNADDHGKNHSFIYHEVSKTWALSAAYDITLNFSESAVYHGLFPTSFGSAPRLPLLAAAAADAGVTQREFDGLDAAVQSAVARWPEFAAAADLPTAEKKRAALIHTRLAAELDTAVSVFQSRRLRPVHRAEDPGFSL